MKPWLFGLILYCCFSLKVESALPLITSSQNVQTVVPLLTIKGAIGPAVSDYLLREINRANNHENTPLIVITLDTPGGLSASLRDINKAILDSDIPVACLVYPQGARAASAGTYILYACHIAAMASATTLGAATPVNISTPIAEPKNKNDNPSPSAMEKKVLNDAIAYIRSLAQLRVRNEKWAVLAVSDAATLTADEALKENVIDIIAQSPQALLDQLNKRYITIKQKEIQLSLTDAILQPKKVDWRNLFIATITDPNIAYILMLIGIYGLLLEFYSPGIGIAGITGAIALFIALYAFQLLPLNFAGAGLLLLGICLMVAEAMIPSFGIFGMGGVIAFVFGSIFLIDTEQTQFHISRPLIAAVALVSILFLSFSLGYLWRARNAKVVSGKEEIFGAWVDVADNFTGKGYVIFNGERWAAQCAIPVVKGQRVQVIAINGLVLVVKPSKIKENIDGTII